MYHMSMSLKFIYYYCLSLIKILIGTLLLRCYFLDSEELNTHPLPPQTLAQYDSCKVIMINRLFSAHR
jgi:hypothetical protein